MQTDRRFMRFYLPKLVVVGLIWISAVTIASWQEYNELQDPTYFYRLDTTNFTVRERETDDDDINSQSFIILIKP